MKGKAPYLVAYDIANPRRLSRIGRRMTQFGVRVQYSVFFVTLTARRLEIMLKQLERMIDPRQDDVRVYPLPERLDVVWLGQMQWPEGVLALGEGVPTFTNSLPSATVSQSLGRQRRKRRQTS